MKVIASIIATLVIFATFFQLYGLQKERRLLEVAKNKAEKKLDELQKENEDMKNEVAYLKNPANLERVARSQFNYGYPNEKLIIITPRQ